MRKFGSLSKTTRIILIIALVLVIGSMISVGIQHYYISKVFTKAYGPDLIVPSPDGQHELVIREWEWWSQGGAEIYIRKPGQDKWYNSWMMKDIGNASTEDLYHPFSRGNYYVEWDSDNVTIYYHQGYGIENGSDRSTWRGVIRYEFE